MKNVTTKILILILFNILFSSCTEKSTIYLNGEKHLNSMELDYGVSLVLPRDFKKAKSFVGIQAANQGGSIEIKMENDFEKLKSTYSEKSIKSKNGKLYRLQPVSYSDFNESFYVEYYDTPQKRYRQVLVISKEEKVYHIKSFHRGRPNHPLSNTIRMALMTTHIGRFVEVGQPFSKAYYTSFDEIIYTRDNVFPTNSPDSLVVTVESGVKTEIKNANVKSFLKSRINNICKGCENIQKNELENGYILKCTARSLKKNALGLMFVNNNNKDNDYILITCVGNEKADLKEVGHIMKSKFISIK